MRRTPDLSILLASSTKLNLSVDTSTLYYLVVSGVGYIAGKFARHLLSKYPEYMDEKDVICGE